MDTLYNVEKPNLYNDMKQSIPLSNALDYEIGNIYDIPLVKKNLCWFEGKVEVRSLARYLMELSLLSEIFLKVRPSVLAQASLLLSHQIVTGNHGWNVDREVEIARRKLMESVNNPPKALYQKYADVDFCFASITADNWDRKLRFTHSASNLFVSGQLTPPKDSPSTFDYVTSGHQF